MTDFSDDIIRYTKRRGGPFDTTMIPATKCLDCSKVFEKKLRWHYEKNGGCPSCEGRLDSKPLRDEAAKIITRLKEAIDSL